MIRVRRCNCLRSRSNGAIDQRSSLVAIQHEIIRKGSKNTLCISMVSILLLFVASCVSQSSQLATKDKLNDEESALHVLQDFLGNLHNGKYDQAAQYYGGSYATMTDQNPDIDPNDHATLLQRACTINGMQCLRAKVIGLEEKFPGEKYVFSIEFLKEDGTLFMFEPCCAGEETNFPPQSVFHFLVKDVDQNKFVVMDMPPYVP